MDVKPIRRVWRGVTFDSQLEADWAATFDTWGIEYVYHPGSVWFDDGVEWQPDFQLDGDIIFEVKGEHNHRIEKAHRAIDELGLNVIIGRAGVVPRGSDIEFAGAVWEPKDWVVTNVASRLRFVKSSQAVMHPAMSADIAFEHGLDGIRWFKAVGDDGVK